VDSGAKSLAGPPTPEQIARGLAIMRKHGMRFADPR